MAEEQQTVINTERDREILRSLHYNPLTAEQLLKVSQTFAEPHTNLDYLRRRMQKLCAAGWVRSWPYATTSRGALQCFKLTRDGYRLLHGPEAALPPKSYFDSIAPARQEHTRLLADVIVHARVSAHNQGIGMTGERYENQVTLTLGPNTQRPDFIFQLRAPNRKSFNYLVELDLGSEPVASDKDRESIQQKIAFHEKYQSMLLSHQKFASKRYRLLFFTRSQDRAYNILSLARALASNKDRRLCYAVTTEEFLAENDAVRAPVFLDHRGQWQTLVNLHPTSRFRRTPVRFPVTVDTFVGM